MTAAARRRWSRAASTATVSVLVLAGALAGPGAAPGQESTLAYTCQLPAGPTPVAVAIRATFPDTAAAGVPIQPGDVSVTLALPRDAVAGATSVAGTAKLTVAVSQNGTAAGADWTGLEVPTTPVPDEGDVVLTAAGAVAAVTVKEPGDVGFTAGDLGFELALPDATVSMGCTLDAGQNATLGTVPAGEAPPPGSTTPAPSTPSRTSPDNKIEIGPSPAAGPQAAPGIPPECGNIPVPPRGRVGCTYVTGYTNVRKLNGSVRVEPGLTNVGVARPVLELPFLRADNPSEIVGGKFPPMRGSFLAFGFVPIEASLELAQVGPMNIHTDGLAVTPFTYSVTATGQLSARIFDATVNGVPLNVGPNCRTERPIAITLTGGTPAYTDILKGGPLSGVVEIPPFQGCGVSEDLDPLLTGTVSGPGNLVKVTQGTLCVPIDPRSPCPPAIPQVPPPGSS